MKTPAWLGIAGAIALGCLALVATYNYAGNVPARMFVSQAVAAAPASSHVKINLGGGGGHGSGTHIGNGYILTAAHVATTKEMEVVGDNDTAYEVDILWVNKEYDVALLRLKTKADIVATPLSCAPTYVGQQVQTFGSPVSIDHVYSRGEVVSEPRKWMIWESVVVVDGSGAPGQSGAAVVSNGQLVGIHVGGLRDVLGARYGFSLVVPGRTICDLMGRAA